jgi:hypothetical protein
VEKAWYESAALRRFVGVDVGVAHGPDETTVRCFWHLLDKPIWVGYSVPLKRGSIVEAWVYSTTASFGTVCPTKRGGSL